jgi:hypothetical protein
VPLAQSTRGAVSPAQWVPAGHVSQVGGAVEVPGAVCTVPALHVPCGWHDAWFAVEEYVSAAQSVQARSAVDVPTLLT